MRLLVSYSFILVTMFFNAQEKQKENAPFTIRGGIGINKPITSKQFRNSFLGIFEANVSLNYQVFGNFYAGLGYQSTNFKNSERFKFILYNASLSYNTRLIGDAGFLKLGYDKFVSESIYMSYALNSGYMFAHYTNVNRDTSLVNRPYPSFYFSAPYIQPELSVNFITENALSFSLMFSYTTLFYNYNAKAPRFNHIDGIQGVSNKYVMSWINFGFGFNVLIGGKK